MEHVAALFRFCGEHSSVGHPACYLHDRRLFVKHIYIYVVPRSEETAACGSFVDKSFFLRRGEKPLVSRVHSNMSGVWRERVAFNSRGRSETTGACLRKLGTLNSSASTGRTKQVGAAKRRFDGETLRPIRWEVAPRIRWEGAPPPPPIHFDNKSSGSPRRASKQ